MGISSLGAGSSILTQDVLDQLRAADEAGQVTPIELSITHEEDKKNALELIDTYMTNLADSVDELNSHTLYAERDAAVVGTSVEVSADGNTDIQDFTLDVSVLATKQIEESGAFTSNEELIANGAGTMKLNVDGLDFAIDYDETTTLTDLKNLINDVAGDKVDATIVQISSGEFRLFVSSVDTGTTQNITMSDTSTDPAAQLKDTRLTTDMAVIQAGVDAEFTFNGQAITRTSNDVSDLIAGLDITLKELGSSSVSVTQDRDALMSKFDSFVTHYNAAMVELDKMTLVSTESEERGIFSSESTIKSMKRDLENMFSSVGGGVGSIQDYGFDVDKEGVMTLDKTVLNDALDDDATNVEAFFAGGDFDNGDGTTTAVEGAFVEMNTTVESYTKYNATLDMFATSITDNISTLEDRLEVAIERLDSKYEIMAKQWAAYDILINSFNSTSAMFTEMVNAENAN
jgi:flagellar hook-associated protein 2